MHPDLDEEVTAALASAGLGVRSVQNVTTMTFPGYSRATYRVALESGGTIKARCLVDEGTASQVFAARCGLPDVFVPVIGRYGRVLLEPWVDGRVVGPAPALSLLVAAAGQLAKLHRQPLPPTCTPPEDGSAAWRRATDTGLQTLAVRSLLTAEQAANLQHEVARCDPRRLTIGLGHFDFCGENMIVDGGGHLRVIDNERIGAGPLGFDLARTWYRWGLPASAWKIFLDAYTAAAERHDAIGELPFWRIGVLVHSACLRLDMTARAEPVEALRRLAMRREQSPT